VTSLRRFPFGHEPAPRGVERPQAKERLTMPLEDSGPPSRPALPFRAAVILPPPVVDEAPALADEAPERPRVRRWLRLALIVLGLLLYAAAIAIIVAPISWGP
jgi:hypothetical protein